MEKLLYLLLFCPTILFAQLPPDFKQLLLNEGDSGMTLPGGMFLEKSEPLGECLLTVTYKLSFVNDTLKKNKRSTDILKLQIGKDVTKCYSYLLYRNDSIRTLMKKKGIYQNFPRVYRPYFSEDVYTFLKSNKTQVMQRGSEDVLPFYWYSEETPKINWKLSDETKTMIGYNCKKATCRFRGRNYIAWYAMDIPIKAGPYKFSGLP